LVTSLELSVISNPLKKSVLLIITGTRSRELGVVRGPLNVGAAVGHLGGVPRASLIEAMQTRPVVTVNLAVVEFVSDPLVPVIVRVYVAAMVELQETVAVPEPVTVAGVIEPQVRFVGAVSVRLTTPVKPQRAVTVIVEVAEALGRTGLGEVALMLKPGAALAG
jgi:hypothetical protein